MGINWTQIPVTESDRRVMESAQDAAQDRKELIYPVEGNRQRKMKSSHVYIPSKLRLFNKPHIHPKFGIQFQCVYEQAKTF